jgi:elongation factor Ts
MATITTEQIKELRDKTGVSVMQCKKALEEANGDSEKALVILRKVSKQIAEKKSDRVFGAGTVGSYVHSNGVIGALVELVCETDFVSGNADFKTLARDIAMHITASRPEFLKAGDVPAEATKAATAVFEKEAADAGKPEKMRAGIVEGKLKAYLKEKILLEQEFVKNPDVTIAGLIDSAIQKFGEKIEISRFACFSVLGK